MDSRRRFAIVAAAIVSLVLGLGVAAPVAAPTAKRSAERPRHPDRILVKLRHVDAWTSLRSRVVACSDVRAVTALVAAGEVDAGIVYATEARGADVRVVHEIDPGSHPPIVYPLLLVKGASPRARAVVRQLGRKPSAAPLRRRKRQDFPCVSGGLC